MNRRTLFTNLGLVALIACLVGLVGMIDSHSLARAAPAPLATGRTSLSSDHFALDWNVVASGGATMSSAHFVLSATIGQAATGAISSTHFGGYSGYWQGFLTGYRIYLPLTIRN